MPLPKRKPESRQPVSKPKQAIKITPRQKITYFLLRQINPFLHKQLTKKGNQKAQDIFRNLINEFTQGKAVSEQRLKQIITIAAKRALNLDLPSIKRNRFPKKLPMLFETGAQMTASFEKADLLYDYEFQSKKLYRLIVRPSIEEYAKLKDFEKKILAYRDRDRDVDEITELNHIGYFAFSIEKAKQTGEQSIFVWTKQMRDLPALSNKSKNRYKNWSLELVRQLEAIARARGIKTIYFNAEYVFPKTMYAKGLKKQYKDFFKRIEKLGYTSIPIANCPLSEYWKLYAEKGIYHTKTEMRKYMLEHYPFFIGKKL